MAGIGRHHLSGLDLSVLVSRPALFAGHVRGGKRTALERACHPVPDGGRHLPDEPEAGTLPAGKRDGPSRTAVSVSAGHLGPVFRRDGYRTGHRPAGQETPGAGLRPGRGRENACRPRRGGNPRRRSRRRENRDGQGRLQGCDHSTQRHPVHRSQEQLCLPPSGPPGRRGLPDHDEITAGNASGRQVRADPPVLHRPAPPDRKQEGHVRQADRRGCAPPCRAGA